MSMEHLTNRTPEEIADTLRLAQETNRKNKIVREKLGKRLLPLLLATEVGQKYSALSRKTAEGSIRAAVTLQCLECVGGVRADAKACTVRKCPLWLHGPAGRVVLGESDDDETDSGSISGSVGDGVVKEGEEHPDADSDNE